MAAAIPDALRPRLGQFLRLLASDRPGEVVAAAAAIKRTLAGVGADLNDLGDMVEHSVAPVVVFHPPPRPAGRKHPRQPKASDVVLDADACRRVGDALWRAHAGGRLSAWETEFTGSLSERLQAGRCRLSKKQGDALGRLLVKIGEGRAWD